MVKQPGCLGESNQVHHGKGKIGDLLFDTEFMIASCGGPCHIWVETHPAQAKELGLSFNRID